jgi:small subunit ribosomal protein S8
MVLNDSLAQALSHLNNAEGVAKQEIVVNPTSKLLSNVLAILKDHMFVGNYEEIAVSGGKAMKINLLGNINKCGVIKPRFSYEYIESEKIEQKYLPAKGFGVVIVSTSQGLMTLNDAREKKIGGRLVAFCY